MRLTQIMARAVSVHGGEEDSAETETDLRFPWLCALWDAGRLAACVCAVGVVLAWHAYVVPWWPTWYIAAPLEAAKARPPPPMDTPLERALYPWLHRAMHVNMLCIKLFQMLAHRSDHLAFSSPDLACALRKFTDHVPWTEEDDVDQATLSDLASMYSLEIAAVPMKAGMVSLVYAATSMDTPQRPIHPLLFPWGRQHVIKIRRRQIQHRIRVASQRLWRLIHLGSRVWSIETFQHVQLTLRECLDRLQCQTDFRAEVRNLQAFREACASMDYVCVPRVSDTITSLFSTVICMERMHGVPVADIVVAEDRWDCASKFIKMVTVTAGFHCLVHADLHLGNLLYVPASAPTAACATAPGGQLQLLDFGIVQTIEPSHRDVFMEFGQALVEGGATPVELARILLRADLLMDARTRESMVLSEDVQKMLEQRLAALLQHGGFVAGTGTSYVEALRCLTQSMEVIEQYCRDHPDQTSSSMGCWQIHPSIQSLLMVIGMAMGTIETLCAPQSCASVLRTSMIQLLDPLQAVGIASMELEPRGTRP